MSFIIGEGPPGSATVEEQGQDRHQRHCSQICQYKMMEMMCNSERALEHERTVQDLERVHRTLGPTTSVDQAKDSTTLSDEPTSQVHGKQTFEDERLLRRLLRQGGIRRLCNTSHTIAQKRQKCYIKEETQASSASWPPRH